MFCGTQGNDNQYSIGNDNVSFVPHLIAEIDLPLPPDPEAWFFSEAYGLAWPQVLAYSAAIVGLLAFVLIAKSFVGGK